MSPPLTFPLESIRTDGWFERIGEGTASFQALCDIVGPRFFAFALITGARIRALTVDRRAPDQTVVEFAVGSEEDGGEDVHRLTLPEFRTRLVDALLVDEPAGPPPSRSTDIEAAQLHVGFRYLLLAPLYGYSLALLRIDEEGSFITVLADGIEQTYPLSAFQMGLRAHVRDELHRASRAGQRGAIDLDRVVQAREAAHAGDHVKVIELLVGWVAPLSIFLRTPEGQLLGEEARATIAEGLEHLGNACIALGDPARGEEVLRLAVQYAADTPGATHAYHRLGQAFLLNGRPAEALGPLRRAAALDRERKEVWSEVAQAFLARGRWLAAYAATTQALRAGADLSVVSQIREGAERELGAALERWKELLGGDTERPSATPHD